MFVHDNSDFFLFACLYPQHVEARRYPEEEDNIIINLKEMMSMLSNKKHIQFYINTLVLVIFYNTSSAVTRFYC